MAPKQRLAGGRRTQRNVADGYSRGGRSHSENVGPEQPPVVEAQIADYRKLRHRIDEMGRRLGYDGQAVDPVYGYIREDH